MTQPDAQVESNPIHLEFVLSKEEFLASQKFFCSSLASRWTRFNYKGMVPVGIFLMLEAGALFYFHVETFLQVLVAFYGLYLVLNRLLLWPWRRAREFKKYPDHGSLRTFDIEAGGIRVKTRFGSAEMLWARFSKFAETDESFLLFAAPRFLYTLPKRAMPPELLEPLRALLAQNITQPR